LNSAFIYRFIQTIGEEKGIPPWNQHDLLHIQFDLGKNSKRLSVVHPQRH